MIQKKIAEGKDPEIIIYEMAEFGLSRPEAKSKVNKYYDLLGDDEYDEDEVSAPYDTPVQDEVEKVVEEEEPDNAAIYDYYGGANAVATGWVSNTLFEPHIGDSIFKSMAQKEKHLTIKFEYQFKKISTSW